MAAGMLMLGTTACVYETIVPPVVEVPDDVSFNDEIIPIFNASCNTSGCHDGSWNPDLIAANAYNSLLPDGEGTSSTYINLEDPASSLLYTKIAPGGSMEQFSTPEETALILGWIQEGALNN